MREHGPEPADGLRGQARREHRDVPLQVTPDEVPPPAQTLVVTGAEEALGETAADPEPADVAGRCGPDLLQIERLELDLGDAAGQ